MYNVFEFDKRAKIASKSRKAELLKKREVSKLKARNMELGDAYRMRVGKFIKKMIQDPQVISDDMNDQLLKVNE